jgi:hypothetical protein
LSIADDEERAKAVLKEALKTWAPETHPAKVNSAS